jgi:hypothetical protein
MQDADYALKYSMAVVAADPSKVFPVGSIEEDLRAGILAMPADRQKFAAESARQMIADPAVRKREFGRHGALDPSRYAHLGFSGVFTPETVPFDRAALKTRLTSLDYRIERVKCADETNPEWPGDDEIAMGGVAVGHQGATAKVNQFMVADDFDDNEVKVYADPGKLFHRFDLTGAGAWPRTYSTVVMLAEKDGSGFADDLFDPGTHYVYLPNRYEWRYENASDHGWTNFRLPTGTFTFNGHGGSYKVNVHWQVNP